MIIREKRGNLFLEQCDAFVQNISLDCRMGAGIAKEFVIKYPDLRANYINQRDGFKLTVGDVVCSHNVFGLITKFSAFHGVYRKDGNRGTRYIISYEKYCRDLFKCLCKLAHICKSLRIKSLAMPKLGCDLDNCNWLDIKPLIMKAFESTDVIITVCYL